MSGFRESEVCHLEKKYALKFEFENEEFYRKKSSSIFLVETMLERIVTFVAAWRRDRS